MNHTADSGAIKGNGLLLKDPKINLRDYENSESTAGVTATIFVDCFASSLDPEFPRLSVNFDLSVTFSGSY